ncbi:MAG TPA: hypothetical protein PKM57_07130 [Kiritimatiellia bacterium]|nr:hypothetical protein [Kiritimatiellia bacterium]HPS09374.1 hypothetical protein [Kiritimatiellia bacterium]
MKMNVRKRFVHATLLFVTVAFADPVTTQPPLPAGAYPEWSAAKAWRSASSRRETICLNGLWRFRSEPRLSPVEVAEPFYEEDLGSATLKEWKVSPIRGGNVSASADATRKQVGDASLRVDVDIPPSVNFYHLIRYVKGVPSGVKLVLRADMMIELERGQFHIEVQDAQDYKTFTALSSEFGNTKGKWKTVECEFTLPAATDRLKILLLRNHGCASGCQGTVWIDNLRIVKVERPAASGMAPPNDGKWGFARVPGSWKGGGVYWNPSDPCRNKAGDLRFGWYERTVEIPSQWDGRRVLAHFDRISTDAHIYCDGNMAGSIGFMGGDVDLTPFVKPGQTHTLSVLVEGRDSWVILPDLLTRPSEDWKAKLGFIGVAGDVFLASEPASLPVRLGRSRIVTTVKNRRVSVATELNVPVGTASVKGLVVRCDVRDGDRIVKSFEKPVSSGTNLITCSDTWPAAVFWDLGTPKLYTLTVSLVQDGRVLDESLPEPFGFREFEIRGRFFFLNDIKLNLVPCSYSVSEGNWNTMEAMRHWLKGARAAGYNFVYLGSVDRPGNAEVASHLLQVCDEMGMLAAVTPLDIGHSSYLRLDRPEVWAQWTAIVRQRVRQDWNHPSLVLWRMNMNLNCYRQDQNPLVLDGKMEFEPGSASAAKEAAMLKSNAFVASLDPSRPSYNHACGKSGAIYNLNNYLGWPELQDLREWLRVWAGSGDKPLFMAEQAVPYPGDFQMRDPVNWWANEPVMTEYGAIQLGERSYRLEEDDYVDYYDRCWDAAGKTWRSSYGYFCNCYPPILDECTSDYYEALLPAWRTWGISGGVNAWENTWRRLIKRIPGSSLRALPPNVPLATDWANLQRPGFSADSWQYANGGGGEIRCLFDLGRPEEKAYFEPTRRGKVMPELIAPLYAYVGGPGKQWHAQDHAFRSGEQVGKSIVLLNDLRHATTFSVGWQVRVKGEVVAEGKESATVQPAESAVMPFAFRAPAVSQREQGEITATVRADGKDVPVKPFALQVYPKRAAEARTPAGWALFDPVGKTRKALEAGDVKVPELKADGALPADLRVLIVGCNALSTAEGAKLFAGLAERVASGLQVVVFEQTADALGKTFGLRCFTPGARRVWLRDEADPVLAGLANEDLADWRGATTLGPLDGLPESLDVSQRWKRVWRCSQNGVVASTLVEKPHTGSFRPLLDTGFDLRYTPLWECVDGAGRMLFCQLDVTDRIGTDPVADTLLHNLTEAVRGWQAPVRRTATVIGQSAGVPLKSLPASAGKLTAAGADRQVVVLTSGCAAWLKDNAAAVRAFLTGSGTVLAAGLSEADGEALRRASGAAFTAGAQTLWLNPLSGKLPAAFRGVSPAEIHWRKKLAVTGIATVPAGGWRSETGVLASIPVGSGEIVWIAASPKDFKPEDRPDLVFTRVNTERLYTIVLGNLGVPAGVRWHAHLDAQAAEADGSAFYTDKRLPRDDPYADMRW